MSERIIQIVALYALNQMEKWLIFNQTPRLSTSIFVRAPHEKLMKKDTIVVLDSNTAYLLSSLQSLLDPMESHTWKNEGHYSAIDIPTISSNIKSK